MKGLACAARVCLSHMSVVNIIRKTLNVLAGKFFEMWRVYAKTL